MRSRCAGAECVPGQEIPARYPVAHRCVRWALMIGLDAVRFGCVLTYAKHRSIVFRFVMCFPAARAVVSPLLCSCVGDSRCHTLRIACRRSCSSSEVLVFTALFLVFADLISQTRCSCWSARRPLPPARPSWPDQRRWALLRPASWFVRFRSADVSTRARLIPSCFLCDVRFF